MCVFDALAASDGCDAAALQLASTGCGFRAEVGVLPSLGDAALMIPATTTTTMLTLNCKRLAMGRG